MMKWTPSSALPPVKAYLKRRICLSPVTSSVFVPAAVIGVNESASVQVVSFSSRCCTVMVMFVTPWKCVTSTENVAASPPLGNEGL